MKLGRPSKYRPEYCQMAEAIGREGLSLACLASDLNVSRDTISEWCEVYPDFSAACHRAKLHRGAFWERHNLNIATFRPAKGETGITGGQAQLSLFMLQNANHEDFRKSQEDSLRQTLGDLVALATQLHDQRASQPALPEPRIVEHEASESAKSKP